MAQTTLYIQTKAAEFEIEVEAHGWVETGGSNSYGSDEPAWAEVHVDELYGPTGKPISAYMQARLTADHMEQIETAIYEEGH